MVLHEVARQFERLTFRHAGLVHRPTHGIEQDILSFVIPVGPSLAEIGDRGHH